LPAVVTEERLQEAEEKRQAAAAVAQERRQETEERKTESTLAAEQKRQVAKAATNITNIKKTVSINYYIL